MISDEDLATFDQEFRGRNKFGTHWGGCYSAHADCLVLRLIGEVRRLRELADFEVNCQLHDDSVKLRGLLDIAEAALEWIATDHEGQCRNVECGDKANEALDKIREGRI